MKYPGLTLSDVHKLIFVPLFSMFCDAFRSREMIAILYKFYLTKQVFNLLVIELLLIIF